MAGTILAGDNEGGVTLMVMTEELDAGPIVARWPVPLAGRETTPELEASLADLAAEVVPPDLERWAEGEIETEPQDDRAATHVHPFTRADGWIDWRRPAVEIDRQVRALQPWPGAWTTIDDRRIHVRRAGRWAASTTSRSEPSCPASAARRVRRRGARARDRAARGPPTMPADAWRRGLAREHVSRDWPAGGGPPLARRRAGQGGCEVVASLRPAGAAGSRRPRRPRSSRLRARACSAPASGTSPRSTSVPRSALTLRRALRHLGVAEEDRLGAVAQGHIVVWSDAAAAQGQRLDLALRGASQRVQDALRLTSGAANGCRSLVDEPGPPRLPACGSGRKAAAAPVAPATIPSPRAPSQPGPAPSAEVRARARSAAVSPAS